MQTLHARIKILQRTPLIAAQLPCSLQILVMCTGLGVGTAAVLGTLRFIKGWSLKPLIAVCFLPTVACGCYMNWVRGCCHFGLCVVRCMMFCGYC